MDLLDSAEDCKRKCLRPRLQLYKYFLKSGRTPEEDAIRRFLVPPLNMALTSSQAWIISSGGVPLSFI